LQLLLQLQEVPPGNAAGNAATASKLAATKKIQRRSFDGQQISHTAVADANTRNNFSIERNLPSLTSAGT
jgi:hypothetical protein